ncbi:MAG: hypothetical protein M0Q94_11845 [Candidatus Cloacimonetes bacterium]|nr:hypothetical protein [Candidatus Cloacimonadota bacterium]
MRRFFLLLMGLMSFILLSGLTISDFPNDDGTRLRIDFDEDLLLKGKISLYKSFDNNKFDLVSELVTENNYIDSDEKFLTNDQVFYKLVIQNDETNYYNEIFAEGKARAQWFNTDKIPILIILFILCSAVIYYIAQASRGKEFYIRKINGLEALEEAVGRATEMGKPILFVPGIMDLDDMQTIAGLTILGKLAEKVAEYHSKLIVPVSKSMVLTAAREIVKASYLKAGVPDEYDSDSVFYLTDDQFGYVAGVDGIIVREKPAANFLLGSFYAESLIIAETGFASGAIQVAGTAMPSQLPFFVAACDYTLIGEELFAASAYLSKDIQQLGSLKGQDFGKIVIISIILIGVILELFGISGFKNFLNIS